MERRRLAFSLVIMLAVASTFAASTIRIAESTQGKATASDDDLMSLTVSDKPYEFVFSYNQDMQLPELPAGCEATSISTLLRMNGYAASKTEVADAMPKSDWDFVDCFWGDPYEKTGGSCMAPCAAATANLFIHDGNEAVVVKGSSLEELRLPACVWVTINLDGPVPMRTAKGYTCYMPSHCLTIYEIDSDTVYCYDPLSGVVEYPFNLFKEIYEQLGSQAVFIERNDYAYSQ